MDGSLSGERAARNQSLYRSVNEKMKPINEVIADFDGDSTGEWLCECADTHCTVHVMASLREYEAVRAKARTFIVYPGHVFPEVESVVSETDRYTIVEKVDNAGQLAEALDPRHSPEE